MTMTTTATAIDTNPSSHLGRSSSHASFFPAESTPSTSVEHEQPLQRACSAPQQRPQRCGMPPAPQLPQASQPNNVGDLVAKAKKAASSLWMILHAQNCRLPKDKCPHRGCAETRLLLAHVKSCPAGPNFPCPTHCRGCCETRKLLAHYRKCKDMRMKQVGYGRRSGLQPEQSCLVCSLMARYAKSVADKAKASSSGVCTLLSSSVEGKFNVERGLASSSSKGPDENNGRGTPQRSPSFMLMPPPPPRHPSVQAPSYVEGSPPNESFGSPPEPSQLMHSKIANVAAITDPSKQATCHLADPSLLGKSVDSSVHVPFPTLLRPEEFEDSSEEELVIPGPAHMSRRRSGSYDERQSRAKVEPNLIGGGRRHGAEGPREEEGNGSLHARPRSASCGSNVGGNKGYGSPSAALGCETIAEEAEHEHDEPLFEMD